MGGGRYFSYLVLSAHSFEEQEFLVFLLIAVFDLNIQNIDKYPHPLLTYFSTQNMTGEISTFYLVLLTHSFFFVFIIFEIIVFNLNIKTFMSITERDCTSYKKCASGCLLGDVKTTSSS